MTTLNNGMAEIHAVSEATRQRAITLIVGIIMVSVFVPMHVFGLVGADVLLLRLISLTMFLTAITAGVLFITGKTGADKALNYAGRIVSIIQSIAMLYIAIYMPADVHYIIFNSLIILVCIIFMSVCFLNKAAIFASLCNILSLTGSWIIVSNDILFQFVLLLDGISMFIPLMFILIHKNMQELKKENSAMRETETELLNIFRFNRKELDAYIKICRDKKPTDKDYDYFFDMLDQRTQRNIINAVTHKLATEQSTAADLRRLFPSLTESELEVTRLILEKKQLSEICAITDKSESNICTIRSHIRKKIGLSPSDKLYNALLDKITNQ